MSRCLVERLGEGTCCGCPGLCVGDDEPAELTYAGQVIIGQCENCLLAIWGPKGVTRYRHSYCGVTVKKQHAIVSSGCGCASILDLKIGAACERHTLPYDLREVGREALLAAARATMPDRDASASGTG